MLTLMHQDVNAAPPKKSIATLATNKMSNQAPKVGSSPLTYSFHYTLANTYNR